MQLNTTVTIEIPDNLGSFQAAELQIRNAMFKSGLELMSQLFGLFEKTVPDRKSFWIKDKRSKTIQTLVGEIRLDRYRVFDHKRRKLVYPLDEWLGLTYRDGASPGLKKSIIEACVARPYRQANSEIKRWTGIDRHVMSDWQMVQREARALKKTQPVVYDWNRSPLPERVQGEVNPCPVLAIDLDGTYCHARRKTQTDHDVKVAVMYTGKKREGNSKKRYRLTNKHLVVSQTTESVKTFLSRVAQNAIGNYGLNRDTLVVIHSDGDTWIKTFKDEYCEKAVYRLDPWHLKKKMRETLGAKNEVPQVWHDLIYNEPDKLMTNINMFKVAHTKPGAPEREKLDKLVSYIKNNREGLLPSGVSDEIKKQYPRLFMRGSGQMESNISKTICDRFKLNRMSWSPRGLDNLTQLRSQFLNNYPTPHYPVPVPKHRPKIWDGMHAY